jgi:thioester reductase-like protein
MTCFMTGATGFIGRHLLEQLLTRKETVYCLVRKPSEDRLQEIALHLQHLKGRVVPVRGDLLKPRLGIEAAKLAELTEAGIDHFFHLAALYDLSADSEALARANVEGTRHALEAALALEAGCLHYVSTVAVAGHYEGTFTETMLEQEERLSDPYASTKHDAEVLVRSEYSRPYRIYRPSVVVGHSQTGEIDKIDGIYHIFRGIQRMRETIPGWLPRIGIETGSLNVVPVDFVAKAIDHIAFAKDLDGRTFHIVDPQHRKASEVVDELCKAAKAPTFSTFVKLPSVPQPLAKLLDASEQLPGVRRASDALLAELGIPRRLLGYLGHTTEYSCEETLKALSGSGIELPPFDSYAARLWEFWERNLGDMPARSARLARAVEGKRVLIAGASGRLETHLARRLAASGAQVVLVDPDAGALEELKTQIARAGGTVFAYRDQCDQSGLLGRVLEQLEGIDVVICGSTDVPARKSGALEGLDADACEASMKQHYLACAELVLGLLDGMREREAGHVLLLSSLALEAGADPARLAAAAALDAFATALTPELLAQGIAVTSAHLPPLKPESGTSTAPLAAIDVERAGDVICDALIHRPRRTNTWLGTATEVTRAAAPQTFEVATSLLSRLPASRWTPWGQTKTPHGHN